MASQPGMTSSSRDSDGPTCSQLSQLKTIGTSLLRKIIITEWGLSLVVAGDCVCDRCFDVSGRLSVLNCVSGLFKLGELADCDYSNGLQNPRLFDQGTILLYPPLIGQVPIVERNCEVAVHQRKTDRIFSRSALFLGPEVRFRSNYPVFSLCQSQINWMAVLSDIVGPLWNWGSYKVTNSRNRTHLSRIPHASSQEARCSGTKTQEPQRMLVRLL